jgi:hypothetical protein
MGEFGGHAGDPIVDGRCAVGQCVELLAQFGDAVRAEVVPATW